MFPPLLQQWMVSVNKLSKSDFNTIEISSWPIPSNHKAEQCVARDSCCRVSVRVGDKFAAQRVDCKKIQNCASQHNCYCWCCCFAQVFKTYLSYLILASRGTSQLRLHSQWASRKTTTSPVDSSAPRLRAWMSPSRSALRYSLTLPFHCLMYSARGPFRLSVTQDNVIIAHYLEELCSVPIFDAFY